jgi:glycosyltransferase involved in cell wall biosynthesis
MNILIIPSWYPTEDKPGNGIFFKEQAEALCERGHHVTVAYADLRFKLGKLKTGLFKAENADADHKQTSVSTYIYRRRNITPYFERGRWPQRTLMLEKIFELIVKQHGKPDIIHLHSCRMAVEAAHLSKKFDIPMIYTEHYSGIFEEMPSALLVQLKTALKYSCFSIAVSEQLQAAMSCYGKDVLYIPNMVNTEIFKPQNMQKHCSAPHSSENKGFVFGAMGNLVLIKRFDILIRAFAVVAAQMPDARLFIAGSGREQQNLKALIDELRLNDKIQLTGYIKREEAPQFFNSCDCFVCSSKAETFGSVLIEALACGKPVASTRCGGPQSIINGANGILCEAGSPKALAEAMIFIAQNIKSYAGKIIREDCVMRFSKETVCARLEEIYYNALH